MAIKRAWAWIRRRRASLATPVLASRQDLSTSLEDVLFSLMILGDDRAVKATYVKGRKVHERVTA